MRNDTTIVLCGGPINYSNLPIGTNQSNAMIPVNGKPVIGWILDDLLAKAIRRVTVVLREQDRRLQDFLRWAYAERMDLTLAPLSQAGTIVQSLQAGLQRTPASGLVRIILGDTLIRDPYDGTDDFVYVGRVDESRRWCLAISDARGRVVAYRDKETTTPEPKLALAGYYHLLHGDHLRACVAESVRQGESELSEVLLRYGGTYPIQARPVQQWFDFGHIDNLVEARRRLLQPRAFNSLSINPILNTITKVSEYDQKLQDELDWYLQLPDELKVLAPRVVSHRRVNQRLEIVQEYYGYPNLAELYVYGDLPVDTWLSILRHALRIHQEFRRFPGTLEAAAVARMYIDKTWQRLDAWRRQEPAWAALLDHEKLTFNGQVLRNIREMEGALRQRAQTLAASAPICVIHGDFCFSNILFDVNNQIIRLIDPRGSFGRKGIFGDARYDMAKLRHSVCGLYDYIVADLFELHQDGRDFVGQIYVNGMPPRLAAAFDRQLVDLGYRLDDVRFIEGLLFMSMLPLHHGQPWRQRMMFLTGLGLLNEVL